MKHLLIKFFAIATLALFTVTANASIEIGDHIKFNDAIGSPGGIFHVVNLTDHNEPQLSTFCVEITEYINFTDTYAVEDIGLVTKNGGKTLSSGAAWLYNSFLDGTLANFDITSLSDVNTLQLAIWKQMGYSEGDIDSHIGASWYNTYNPILTGKLWNAPVSWVGTGSIEIINLRKLDSQGNYTDERAQDQVVRLQTPAGGSPPVVPEPVSLIVWSMLALCTGSVWTRRRTEG